mmetsp:Transcript_17473/g.16806  ORF Transcript_17473/g.16806 Transcript_17473/m.16806 type:complete len:114 (-) Transcript_17473:3795-4136(-)
MTNHRVSERFVIIIVFILAIGLSVGYYYYRCCLQLGSTQLEVIASPPHMEVTGTIESQVDLDTMLAEAVSFKYGIDNLDDVTTEAFELKCIVAENIKAYKVIESKRYEIEEKA